MEVWNQLLSEVDDEVGKQAFFRVAKELQYGDVEPAHILIKADEIMSELAHERLNQKINQRLNQLKKTDEIAYSKLDDENIEENKKKFRKIITDKFPKIFN